MTGTQKSGPVCRRRHGDELQYFSRVTEQPDGDRRLTVDFAAWLYKARIPDKAAFRSGLIVLDANVLLDLYRFTPDARSQVLDAFARVGARLWVPHQAAVEFSRNRRRVVEDRMSSFKQVRRLLQNAAADAVTGLDSAVARLLELRERNGTTRTWDPQEAGLDHASLNERLKGVMTSALAELSTLEAEHDLHPKDMQEVDSVLSQIDGLLAGHIGPAYQPAELRALVREAHDFRYPNEIPPGFLDVSKETPLRAAGDFLLWRQTIDKVLSDAEGYHPVIVITKDFKRDWWDVDAKKRPLGPRPELVQEMRDLAQVDLFLVSLKDFIVGAGEHLASVVSDNTLEQITEASGDVGSLLPEIFRDPSAPINLLDLNPMAFERLIHYLLIQMGYTVEASSSVGDQGYDFRLIDGDGPTQKVILVETKIYRNPIPASLIYQMLGMLRSANAQAALLITTASFSAKAMHETEGAPIELIDGAKLIELLSQHGIHAKIELPGED